LITGHLDANADYLNVNHGATLRPALVQFDAQAQMQMPMHH
jgi:hypothetical protein